MHRLNPMVTFNRQDCNSKSFIKSIYRWLQRLAKEPILYLRSSHAGWPSQICWGAFINNSRIGDYCYVGPGVVMNQARIGNYCSIAPYVQIGGLEHSWWWGSTSPRISEHNIGDRTTVLQDDVWIGANAVIRQGVTMGRGSVIGAGAVVLKDVVPYTIVAGVPAKEIRKRFPEHVIREIESTKFWDYPPKRARDLLNAINYSDSSDYMSI